MENKQSTLLELYYHQNNTDDKEYLFSTILYHAAPVLHNDKTAVLLTFATNQRNLKQLWDLYRGDFPFGQRLKFYEIKRKESHVCVLFYDEAALTDRLMQPNIQAFLKTEGYDKTHRLTDILSTLRKHSTDCCPHEVGIFIGYPLEDVVGFIENQGKNCLTCGYWKVYANPEKKQAKFKAYDLNRKQMIEAMVLHKHSPVSLLKRTDMKQC